MEQEYQSFGAIWSKMSQERQGASDLTKLHSIQGGSRGVVTRHESEIKDVIACSTDPQKRCRRNSFD